MGTQQELVDLQQTLYTSKNPTRRHLHCCRRNWVIDKIEKYAPGKNIRSLEVGPGSGIYLPVLSRVSESVVASDIETAHLDNLQSFIEKYPNVRLIQDNIKESRLSPGSFDLILCSEVIEHIDGSGAVLKNLNELLAPQGVLILTTPQRFSTLELCCKVAFLPGIIDLVRLLYKEPVLETGHISLMTESTLKGHLEQANFQVVEQHKCGLYLPFFAEFMGEAGLLFEKWMEKNIRNIPPLSAALWTQCYVLEKR